MAFINGQKVQLIVAKGEKGDKGDPTSVVQITGSNKESVMSQKATTDALEAFGLRYRSYELIYGSLNKGAIMDWTNTEYRNRAITKELIEVKAGMKIQFTPNSVYQYGYAFYNTGKVYDGVDRGWLTKNVTIEEDGYIYLNFTKLDGSDLTEENLETLKSICKIINNSFEEALTEKLDMFGLYYRDYDIMGGTLQNGVISEWLSVPKTRAVTTNKIPVKAGTKIRFNDASGIYRFGYAFYDTDEVFDGKDSGWKKGTVRIDNDGYIAIHFKRADEAVMNEQDFANIKEAIWVINDSVIELGTQRVNDDIKNSTIIEYGRVHGASYVFARIPKTTNDGNTVTAKLALTSADGSLTGTKVSTLNFAKRENTAFTINAGIFNVTAMQPVGQTIINGISLVSAPMQDDNGVPISDIECYPLCIDANGNLSAPYSRNVTVEKMITDGVKYAVVGWGKLVDDFEICDADIAGEIVHSTDYIRQSIGQFENGDYFVCTVEQSRGNVTNEAGLTYTELAELLVAKGVKFAYSLDGGGSASTVIGKRQLNRIYEGTEGRAVPTVIYFCVK